MKSVLMSNLVSINFRTNFQGKICLMSLPGCIMQPAVTFVNYVYTIKILQYFRHMGIPLTAIFLCTTHEPAHNNGCGPLT